MKQYIYMCVGTLLLATQTASSFMIIGHRGACGYAPENTIVSFEKAIELGATMVEFDVRQCASGELVVIHDDMVDRTTNGKGAVNQKTLAELQSLMMNGCQIISTLQEVLQAINRRVKVNIELKDKNIALRVVELVERFVLQGPWTYDDFLISSFFHGELFLCKQYNRRIKIGMLFPKVAYKPEVGVKKLSPDIVVMHYCSVTPEMIAQMHGLKKLVFVYTVNESDDIKYMVECGVDGIISDFPDRVALCVRSYERVTT